MKNLLIISYCFPPTQEIGGLRPYLLAKYIKNFGYNPIIVTKYDSEELDKNFNIIITDKFIDSYNLFQPKFTIKSNLLFTIIKDIISFPDYQYRWKNICLEAINKHVNLDNIDIIYSTSSPITCHLIAKTLKRKLNIPWVADLRDLWYGNHYNNNLLIRSVADKLLEINTLRQADYITTTTNTCKDNLLLRHSHCPVESILTGFNPEELSSENTLEEKLSITYAGGLYGGKRDPSLLFQAVSYLINNGTINRNKIEINFYTEQSEALDELIKKFNLNDVVHHHNKISRNEILSIQRRSHLLLILLLLDNSAESGVITGKLYEYLASRRPILCIGPSTNEMKFIISDLSAGQYTTTVDEIIQVISAYYNEFIKTGIIENRTHENKLLQYSGEAMIKKFASIFDDILIGMK